jgi:predicted dehydrogenase
MSILDPIEERNLYLMDKVLIVGAGSIGCRHIQCLKEIGVADVFVCEPGEVNMKAVRSRFDIAGAFTNLAEAIKTTYDGVIVCVPNHLHAAVAVPIIERGMPVLLEKPIEVDLASAQKINEAVNNYNVVCQIGYCLRFSSAMEQIRAIIDSGTLGKVFCADVTVGQYLPDWRPGVDYRKVYSAIKSQGGGVCLDISHELDYFRWFFGEPVHVQSHVQKVSGLEIEVEDVAETIVITDRGTVGRIHLDYLSRISRRRLSIIAEKGNIEYDFITGILDVYEAGSEFWKRCLCNEDRNAMYNKQLRHFMDCVKNKYRPLVDAADAIKTLEFALKIRNNSKG